MFAAYGEVEEGAVVMDKNTGKSRGFAFVTFKDILGAHRALKEPSKKVLVSTRRSARDQQSGC